MRVELRVIARHAFVVIVFLYKGTFKSSGLYINDVCILSDRKQKHDKNTNSI